jgi:oligosaccharide repeat unit polymerase
MKFFLIAIYFGATLLPILFEIKNKHFDFLNLKNAFLFYLFFQIGAYEAIQSVAGIEASWYRPIDYHINYSILMAIIGTICFNIFYYSTPKLRFLSNGINTNGKQFRNVFLGAILVLFGYIMFLALLSKNGGLSEFISNLQTWRTEGVSGQGIFIFPATVGLSMGALLFSSKYSPIQTQSKANIKLILLALVVALIPPIIIGFRGLILSPIIHWLIVFREPITSRLNKKRAITISFVILLIFTAFGLYRQWSEVVSERLSLIEGAAIIFDSRPELVFDVFLRSRGTDVVGTVISKLEGSNQFIGITGSIAEAVSIVIPRVFVDKPEPLSVQFSKIFFGVNGGVSPTAIGEFYWMGGEIAVAIGMAFLGVFAKLVYSYYSDKKSNLYSRVAYAFLFIHFALMAEAIQGNLNAIVMIFSFYFVMLFALHLNFASRKAFAL